MKRIFIVGIPCAGNRLLEKYWALHPGIRLFSESQLFEKTIHLRRFLRIIHSVDHEDREFVSDYLTRIGKEELFEPYAGGRGKLGTWVQYLLHTLDRVAESDGKPCWVEQTPRHLYYVNLLDRFSEDAHFIHIIRHPLTNIAALHEASKEDPVHFKQFTLEKAIKRYRRETRLTEDLMALPNHRLVYFEDLIDRPAEVMTTLFEEVGCSIPTTASGSLMDIPVTGSTLDRPTSEVVMSLREKQDVKGHLTEAEITWLETEVRQLHTPFLRRYASIN